jgi:hypothetical protein
MMIKKSYNVGDTVWIYGIDLRSNKPKKGVVVKSFTLDLDGYDDKTYYVVSIPNEIEPLLEIRTWHTISQDEKGPVGSFRELSKDIDITQKVLSKTGMSIDREYPEDDFFDEDEVSPEKIRAALEKSQEAVSHAPLNLKDAKPKPKYKPRKRKTA